LKLVEVLKPFFFKDHRSQKLDLLQVLAARQVVQQNLVLLTKVPGIKVAS
jgi:hypothetical protein